MRQPRPPRFRDRKSTRLNSSHGSISYAVFCLKKKKPHAHAPPPFPTLAVAPPYTELRPRAVSGGSPCWSAASARGRRPTVCLFFFFFNDTATTEIYTLSLHDALPIWDSALDARGRPSGRWRAG